MRLNLERRGLEVVIGQQDLGALQTGIAIIQKAEVSPRQSMALKDKQRERLRREGRGRRGKVQSVAR